MSKIQSCFFCLIACLIVATGCGDTNVRPEIINQEDTWNLNDVVAETTITDITDDNDISGIDIPAETDVTDDTTADTGDADISVELFPAISVDPTEVDFGFGAINTPKIAEITISNDGDGPLTVHGMKIMHPSTTDYGIEFAIVYDPTFLATDQANPADSTIAAHSSKIIQMTFTNKGPANGQVSAWLVIDSNSPDQETVDVSLVASRAGTPECRLQIVPSMVNFGTVSVGFPEIREARLVNTGTGNCVIKQYSLADCPTSLLSTACPAVLSGDPSPWFKLVQTPESATVSPGSTAYVKIEFTPPDGSDPFITSTVNALLSFKIQDPANNTYSDIPECPLDGCTPNVTGQVGEARASVLPVALDFGIVSVGCSSMTEPLCVYNFGDAPLKITALDYSQCSREISFGNLPTFPEKITSGNHFCFDVTYLPVNEGRDECTASLSVSDILTPTINIPIAGQGTTLTSRTDTFNQISGADVDVLFVIDDSGSMCEEQERLVTAFSDFISQATTWKNDYRIAVISVNVTEPNVIGRFNRGDKTVTPRFITKSPDAQAQFNRLVAFGCDGASSEREAGLEAAQAALSAPLTTNTGTMCNSHSDCSNNPLICSDSINCPYQCLDGYCSGFNAGFIRPDAGLEIIMLSDEDDQSTATVNFYAEFFKSLKTSPDKVHVNTIVGILGVPGGPSDYGNDCVATDGSTAINGVRYLEASALTDGIYGSICEMSFAPVMQQISDAAFLPDLDYKLSMTPDANSIRVLINNAGCAAGWHYDQQLNSVVFDAAGPCTPVPGNTLKITYNIVCLQ